MVDIHYVCLEHVHVTFPSDSGSLTGAGYAYKLIISTNLVASGHANTAKPLL